MRSLAACVVVGLALAAETAAAPPDAGVLVPGTSLGGVRLGWTLRQVTAVWGRAYGRCRSCTSETLYFNRYAFRPEGAGVVLRRGRVAAVFTLWGPAGWSTRQGVRVGDPAIRVSATYGSLPRRQCPGYAAYVLAAKGPRSAVYIVDEKVWGFALLGAGMGICR